MVACPLGAVGSTSSTSGIRLQVSESVARRLQHHDSDVERRQVLLVLEFPIDGQERIEVSGNRDA
jgi:hypothetical protein